MTTTDIHPTCICPRCGVVPPRVAWKLMTNGRAHLGVWCSVCGRWLRWAPQTSRGLALAPEESPAEIRKSVPLLMSFPDDNPCRGHDFQRLSEDGPDGLDAADSLDV
jgi:hypothetical protein